jgi:2-amino-4-hydroxy-6-hydroxymethyldihydropteridine diphosphokinase
MGRVRAYIGLGANVGDAPATLAAAVQALDDLPGARVRGVSRLYTTTPVGVLDQPDFHNAVVALDVVVPAGVSASAAASSLLVALKGLEQGFGRQQRYRWGPREVDLDLLVFGRHAISVARPAGGESANPAKAALPLTVPHVEARHRLFVLAPLADLAPGLVPPGWGETVASAAARQWAAEGTDAARVIGTWTGERWSGAAAELTP